MISLIIVTWLGTAASAASDALRGSRDPRISTAGRIVEYRVIVAKFLGGVF